MAVSNLIQTVRGLDQTGPGQNGENLDFLWQNLTVASSGRFHAAEESALRWLLKSMNGASQGAETIRRYPLTWTILTCVFRRIPLFSLAKSLADRRFVSVLQQTLKDISTPTRKTPGSPSSSSSSSSSSITTTTTTTTKRKRSPSIRFHLDDLGSKAGCLATGQAVFTLLRSLLLRLGDETIDSRSRIGAEHIKSLFSTSAAEAATLSSAALTVCNLLLNDDHFDSIEGRNDWIRTISAIWHLHLQGADDVLEVATHLFRPSLHILARLEGIPGDGQHNVNEALATRWSADLSRFMHTNLILPARKAFLGRQDLEPVTRALDIAINHAGLAAPVLYLLAAGAPEPENERDVRRGNATWMRQIFQTVEARLRNLPDRNRLMERVLGLASSRSILVDVEDLRVVSRDYGMTDGKVDWDLLAKAAVCNPNIFSLSQEGDNLLTEVCQKSVAETDERRYPAMADVIAAIQKSFCTRRNFSGFLKLWYKQLSSVVRLHYQSRSVGEDTASDNLPQVQGLISKTPWFALSKHVEAPSAWIESETSPSLLLEVVEWVRNQEHPSDPHALCTFADSIGRGLRTEAFIDGVGGKLLDFIFTLDPARPSALKWRVVSRAFSWAPRESKATIWGQVKDELSQALTGSVQSPSFFEAFKCCNQIWDSVERDESTYAHEVTALVRTTAKTVFEAMFEAEYKGPRVAYSDLDRDSSSDYHADDVLRQYLAWYIFGTSRALKLYWTAFASVAATREEGAPFFHPFMYTNTGTGDNDTMRVLWDTLLANEININDRKLSEYLITLLISHWSLTRDDRPWPGERGSIFIRFLSKIPSEAMVDDHRRSIMNFLEEQRPKMKRHSKAVTFGDWKAVLDLATKISAKPITTRHPEFATLVDIADALSNVKYDLTATSGDALLEMIERFSVLASTTLKERAAYPDRTGPHYFMTSEKFVSDCDDGDDKQSLGIAAFRITLLKALATELKLSRRLQSMDELTSLLSHVTKALAKRVASVMREFVEKPAQLLSTKDRPTHVCLFAAMDAATALDDDDVAAALASEGKKSASIRELDESSKKAMAAGDFRGWKLQIFIQRYMAGELGSARPTKIAQLPKLSTRAREELLKDYVDAVIRKMDMAERTRYLAELIHEFAQDCDTDGQILAIEHVVNQLIDKTDSQGKAEGADLAAAHSQLISCITRKSPNSFRTCRVLQTLLEKKPQAMGQWNIEITLSTIAKLASQEGDPVIPFPWLCKLVGVIIKKHRLRLEGHYHVLLTIMQALLRALVNEAPQNDLAAAAAAAADRQQQESRAHLYGRLVSLICEPTAGSVARPQHQGALDSATDVAKRSAGRHMYLVLMQYVKLQLEAKVGRPVLEALEPAMNTVFDITPPEVRKILNDAMDASGRAVLREMYKRYVKFGKWSGI